MTTSETEKIEALEAKLADIAATQLTFNVATYGALVSAFGMLLMSIPDQNEKTKVAARRFSEALDQASALLDKQLAQ